MRSEARMERLAWPVPIALRIASQARGRSPLKARGDALGLDSRHLHLSPAALANQAQGAPAFDQQAQQWTALGSGGSELFDQQMHRDIKRLHPCLLRKGQLQGMQD